MNSLKLLEVYSSGEGSSDENERNIETTKISPVSSNAHEPPDTGDSIPPKTIRAEWNPLPIPSSVQEMFSNMCEPTQEEHQGKMRSFPHERGIWATFVYIEYIPVPEFYELIGHFIEISSSHGIELVPSEHFHISLTRTLKLKYHWIPSFVSALNAHLRHITSFKVMFQSTEVYVNDEKTRTFVGLKVHFGFENLLRIMQKIDKSLEEFHLPPFHEDPSFHLTCTSVVGNKADDIELFMADLNVSFQSFVDLHPHCRTLWVKEVYCKAGNKLFCVPLKK